MPQKYTIDTMERWQRALDGIKACLDEIPYTDPLREVTLIVYEKVWQRVMSSREEYTKEFKNEQKKEG